MLESPKYNGASTDVPLIEIFPNRSPKVGKVMLLALIVSPASAWLPANKSVESIAASGSVVESSEIKLTKLRSGTMTGEAATYNRA